MQTRHRVPTIFTLYMVDVLCCALGCVILLWFLKIHEVKQHVREAERYEKQAKETSERLARTEQQLLATSQESERRGQEVTRKRLSLEQTQARLDAISVKLAETRAQLEQTTTERDRLRKERDAVLTRLAALGRQMDDLKSERATLQDELQERAAMLQKSTRAAEDLADKLTNAEARLKDVVPLAAAVPGLRAQARKYRDQLADLRERMASLEKDVAVRGEELAGADRKLSGMEETNRRLRAELSEQNRQIAGMERQATQLQEDKKNLSALASRERAARENRFAGIALTGRRVVFLVDMSGSMELVDLQTAAPEKWTGVRETLAKIMRSLPSLEKFQVILFAERATYLLNSGEDWIDFKGQASVDQAVQALSRIKPEGNTNMYIALEAAFRFKPAGMDTIYLLSDGLPNIGAGLAPEAAQNMTEPQRAEILGKHIRRKLLEEWNPKNDRGPRVKINTVGFFFESPDVGAFLWALARENDGSFVGMSKP